MEEEAVALMRQFYSQGNLRAPGGGADAEKQRGGVGGGAYDLGANEGEGLPPPRPSLHGALLEQRSRPV